MAGLVFSKLFMGGLVSRRNSHLPSRFPQRAV